MRALLNTPQCLVLAGLCMASLYAWVAALALPFFGHPRRGWRRPGAHGLAGVSVLKPLCGAEPRLYENLASFCDQTHPRFQLVFGVACAADPAIEVVRRLRLAYPRLDITLVVDPRVHGANRKVSNLMNMLGHARHELIVIADSDIEVTPRYLETVLAPLADPAVGIVTCLYRSRPVGGGSWARLGAMFVNEWFAPSVRVACLTGSRSFGFGSTLALRRATLNALGGLGAVRDCLADDFWLAEHTRRLGLRTELAPIVVSTDAIESGLRALWRHETRWLRTIRSVNPAGFASLFITFTAPWVVSGALMLSWMDYRLGLGAHPLLTGITTAVTAAGCIGRLALHARSARHSGKFWQDLALVPARDALLALEWVAAAFGSQVVWRGARLPVSNRTAPVSTAAASSQSKLEPPQPQ